MTGNPQTNTFEAPPRGFDALTADSASLRKFGLPPRQQNPAAQEKYEQHLRLVQDKLHYIPAKVVPAREFFSGRVRRPLPSDRSDNWAGGAVLPQTGAFQAIWGHWTITSLTAPNNNDEEFACASWVGIDGISGLANSTDVCQAGVTAWINGSNNNAVYTAWYEWFPGETMFIANFPLTAGDEIGVSVCAPGGAGATEATAYLGNVTTGAHTSVTFSAPTGVSLTGDCAEWVVEMGQFGYPNFGTITFTDGQAELTDANLVDSSSGQAINMIPIQNGPTVATGSITDEDVVCTFIGPP
jgi:Peptidase A4 family